MPDKSVVADPLEMFENLEKVAEGFLEVLDDYLFASTPLELEKWYKRFNDSLDALNRSRSGIPRRKRGRQPCLPES